MRPSVRAASRVASGSPPRSSRANGLATTGSITPPKTHPTTPQPGQLRRWPTRQLVRVLAQRTAVHPSNAWGRVPWTSAGTSPPTSGTAGSSIAATSDSSSRLIRVCRDCERRSRAARRNARHRPLHRRRARHGECARGLLRLVRRRCRHTCRRSRRRRTARSRKRCAIGRHWASQSVGRAARRAKPPPSSRPASPTPSRVTSPARDRPLTPW